jgi:hypothetical protein
MLERLLGDGHRLSFSGFRVIVLAAAVGSVALAAAGCGGSGTLSASDYRAQAEEICAGMNQTIESWRAPRTAAEYGRYLDQLIAVVAPTLHRLEELEPPKDLQLRHDRAVRLAEQGVGFLRRIARGIHRGENAQQLALTYGVQADAAIGRANAILRALDLPECAKDPQPRKPAPPA